MNSNTRSQRFRCLVASAAALLTATSLALTTPAAVSAQESPQTSQPDRAAETAPPAERSDTTLRAAPMPADAMPLDEPPARASAMARQSPGSALSQEQWNRRPVSQRGETPKLEQEWRATDNPNHEIAPGGMRSDREEVPAGFSKANADKAETMEAALAGGDSEMRTLAAPDCQVYWPAPYEVCGEIRDKYNALGGPNSFLLFPKTNELTNPDGIGKRTEFQNGPIYWSPQGGAHPVANHFLAAWARHGYENSYIGYPTTDELVNPDGIGRRQHFTGSTIYWKLNEAYSIGGAIADKWHTLGAEQGLLGYPISDERILPDGVGRMNRFEHGVIYWHSTTGAHEITGRILSEWEQQGFERSTYGYPVASPQPPQDGFVSQDFQNGTLSSPVINPLMELLEVPYLPFPSLTEANEFFDRVEQGLEQLPAPVASGQGTAARASGERLGPCVLSVSDVYLRKSSNYNKAGFKPLTRCETEILSISHTSDLRYEYYKFWKTAPDVTSVLDYPERENPTKKDSNAGFVNRYETKNFEQQCEGSTPTWLSGSVTGTISTTTGSYYARAYSPHITQKDCEIPD